jgi:hypothetical protein
MRGRPLDGRPDERAHPGRDSRHHPERAAARRRTSLIDLAKLHGGNDNITVILGGVSGDLPSVPAGERVSQTFEPLKEFDARRTSSI